MALFQVARALRTVSVGRMRIPFRNEFAAQGQVDELKDLISKWERCTGKYGAREACVAAAQAGQAEALKALQLSCI